MSKTDELPEGFVLLEYTTKTPYDERVVATVASGTDGRLRVYICCQFKDGNGTWRFWPDYGGGFPLDAFPVLVRRVEQALKRED